VAGLLTLAAGTDAGMSTVDLTGETFDSLIKCPEYTLIGVDGDEGLSHRARYHMTRYKGNFRKSPFVIQHQPFVASIFVLLPWVH